MARTKDTSNFYTERNNKNIQVVDHLLRDELPDFCGDYFLAIDSQTSPLTRMNYAHDLKIFFNFLMSRRFSAYSSAKQFTLADLERVTNKDIEMFLSKGQKTFVCARDVQIFFQPRPHFRQ